MRTRWATVKDLPALMALEKGAFGPKGWTNDYVKMLLGRSDVRTLVLEEDVPIAYAMVHIPPGYETAEVFSLAVSPTHRRRGLGRKLICRMEDEARRIGAQTMMLCVRPDNRAAIDLYLSQGYNVLARCNGYYEDGSAAEMMVKHLED